MPRLSCTPRNSAFVSEEGGIFPKSPKILPQFGGAQGQQDSQSSLGSWGSRLRFVPIPHCFPLLWSRRESESPLPSYPLWFLQSQQLLHRHE